MEQAPNTIETIISKTLELWEMAASDGTIIMGPDYDKDNIKRQIVPYNYKAKKNSVNRFDETKLEKIDMVKCRESAFKVRKEEENE